MRLYILLTLLTVFSVAGATYYDAATCGKPSTVPKRMKRASDDYPADDSEAEELGSGSMGSSTSSESPSSEGQYDYGEDEPQAEYGQNQDGDDLLEEKAMGGSNASPGELPWSVLLEVTAPDGSKGQCGGTLISRRHLVTAAHCFRLPSENKKARCSIADMMSESQVLKGTSVVVGAVCLAESPSDGCTKQMIGKRMTVKRIALYDGFYRRSCVGGHDIALLELSDDVTPSIHHACLPHRHNFDEYTKQTAVLHSYGFGGDPTKKQKKTPRLQKIELDLEVNKTVCMKTWRPSFYDVICTKEESYKNVCTGDSGGGVTTPIEHRHFLVGVISFGSDCDSLLSNSGTDKAQINTDINYYTASIDRFLGDPPARRIEEWVEAMRG